MPSRPRRSILRPLIDLAAAGRGGESDRALLDRFRTVGDEAAFAALVRRHGPMVLGVCRRALGCPHDAEDACQVTFLVLARQAGAVRAASLSSWLHGVACRSAAAIKRDLARRRRRERAAAVAAAADAQTARLERWAMLDEELGRLPERYRAPLIACYLEGRPRAEAADRLGLSPGELHGRLERGRELLRVALRRRGVGLSPLLAGAVPAGLSGPAATATAKGAVLFSAGLAVPESVVSASVISVTRGVLNTMFLSKLKAGVGALLLVVGVLAGSFAALGVAQEKPAAPKAPVGLKADDSDEAFIRAMSENLRGTAPSPAEVHFFVASREPGKRQKLIDLFIQERQAKQKAAAARPAEKRYAVNFRDKPWRDVFHWLGDQAGKPVIMGPRPVGTFSYVAPPGKTHTLPEVIDIINEALLTGDAQKWHLVQRERSFILIPADERVDPVVLPRVSVADLASRGRSEVVTLLLPLKALAAEDVAPDVKKLLGPFGSVVVLRVNNSLQIVDTVGNLRRIVEILQGAEKQKMR